MTLTTAIKAKSALATDPFVGAFDVDVDIDDSQAVLKGHVDSLAQREHAEAIIRTLDGIESVDNQLQLCQESADGMPTQAGLFAELKGFQASEIAAEIEAGLERDPNIEPDSVAVHVFKNGAAALTGEVASDAHRQAAEHRAWVTPGVTYVLNRLQTYDEAGQLTGPEKPVLHPTVAILKLKLALNVGRQVHDPGAVTLRLQEDRMLLKGDVESYREKDRVKQLAESMFPDYTVENELVVGRKWRDVDVDSTQERIQESQRHTPEHPAPLFSKQQVYEAAQEFDQALAQDPRIVARDEIGRKILPDKKMFLDGQVNSVEEARTVEQIAWQVRGVERVINRLSIASQS